MVNNNQQNGSWMDPSYNEHLKDKYMNVELDKEGDGQSKRKLWTRLAFFTSS